MKDLHIVKYECLQIKPIVEENEAQNDDRRKLPDAMEIDNEQSDSDPEDEEAKQFEADSIDSASDTECDENHRPRKKRKKLPEEEFFNFENDFDDPNPDDDDDDEKNLEKEISGDILLWRAEQLTTAEKVKQKEFEKNPLKYWKKKITKWSMINFSCLMRFFYSSFQRHKKNCPNILS